MNNLKFEENYYKIMASGEKELRLFTSNEDCLGIYQLKNHEYLQKMQFMPYEFIKRTGISVTKEIYDLLYVDKLEKNVSLEDIFVRFNIDRPQDFKGHSLSVSDVVVLHRNNRNYAFYVDSIGYVELPRFIEQGSVAFHVEDRYVIVQECDEGYDYTYFDEEYELLDGGVYDDPCSMKEAIGEIMKGSLDDQHIKGAVTEESIWHRVDFDDLKGKLDQVMENQLDLARKEIMIQEYRNDVLKEFHPIQGMDAKKVTILAKDYLQSKIEAYDLDAKIIDIVIGGSRSKGTEREDSDLDFIVQYVGSVTEDFLFNIAHEDGYNIGGIPVDMNPIKEDKSGTLYDYICQRIGA